MTTGSKSTLPSGQNPLYCKKGETIWLCQRVLIKGCDQGENYGSHIPLGLLISWVSVPFIGVAFIAATLGIQMLYPITLQSASAPHSCKNLEAVLAQPACSTYLRGLLLGSAMAWISLAVILQSSSHGSDITRIQSLPPSAAGEPSGHLLAPNRTTSTTSTIKAAMHGEELVNSPDGPEFKKLKKHLSRLLLSAPEFDDPAKQST